MIHVVHAGRFTDESFPGLLARDGQIELEELSSEAGSAGRQAALARAHIYQITSARDDIAADLYAAAPLLAAAPVLLAVSTGGAGFDTVDLAACTAAGVLAVNQTGGNEEAVAEHALAMMLCLSKRIGEADRALRAGTAVSRFQFKGNDILGKTLGIVGFGRIGRRFATLAKVLDMRVLAYDPHLTADTIERGGASKTELDVLLTNSDVVSLHCPLTPETRNLIGAREYALMRPGAFFISTARGFVHDEIALAASLVAGHLAGAGLDVWEREPPGPNHPLLSLPNVLATPHTAGGTLEARRQLATMAAEQIQDILAGRRPPRLLNPEVWPAFAARFARIIGRPVATS